MNKINSFFGYFLFRLINRWQSSKNYLSPEHFAGIIFITFFVLPLITILILANNFKLIHYEVDEIEIFCIYLYIIFMFYSMYLESWIKKNSKQYIHHKLNKYPVNYIYYFIIINILILLSLPKIF